MTTREEIDAADHRGADIFFKSVTEFWDLTDMVALDMFARDGSLTVSRYRDKVRILDLWELNAEHEAALRSFAPRELKIGCSYQNLAAILPENRQYDLLVIDTPQGSYRDGFGQSRVEHFDLMYQLHKIMSDSCVLIFYVNKMPYNRDEVGDYGNDSYSNYDFDQWLAARQNFYGVQPGEELSEEKALRQYKRVFQGHGFHAKHTLITPCYDFADGLPPSFRCAIQFDRN